MRRHAASLAAAACLLGLPSAAQTSPALQCAPNANCSRGQSGGLSIGVQNAPITVNIGPPRDPHGLYQLDNKIGRAWTVDIDKPRGVVVFHKLAFNAYIDPTQPIEFADMALHCKDAPVEGARLVANISVMIAGDVVCEIVRAPAASLVDIPSPDRTQYKKALQGLYLETDELLEKIIALPRDDQMDEAQRLADELSDHASAWIKANMGPVAVAKYKTPIQYMYGTPWSGEHNIDVVNKRMTIIDGLKARKTNLEALMASDRWDPPEPEGGARPFNPALGW